VAAEIVHDDDVTLPQRGHENFFDVGPKAFAVDRSLDQPWRDDPIMAQGRQERRRLPATVRDFGGEPLAA